MQFNYLKYWRVVRYWIKSKYGLTTGELDVLLFLYVKRFDKLLRDKWIEVFRKRTGKNKALYQLSYKGKRVVNSIYKKLNGEEIPSSEYNPIFLRNVSYTDKVYKNFIKEMNKSIKQQRHLSQK